MKKALLALPLAAALTMALLAGGGVAGAQSADGSYSATLAPVAANTPAGAASGQFTVVIKGDQATVSEHVSGLADKLPTDTATLASIGVPAAFAGKPFPHVQHIHINGNGVCPEASADANGDGVISTVEGQPAYGKIGTTLSTSGATDASTATDVTVAPGGGGFTYERTFTINQATLSAITANKAVIVVHGLNPASAPKASLTTPNSLKVTLPGASKQLALIGTAPALCGRLVASTSQMNGTPAGGVATGGGSTAGLQDEALFLAGGALLAAAMLVLVVRQRVASRR